MTRRPLGVVDIVYAARGDEVARAQAAAADGYAHIDPLLGTDPATLALPIGCPTAFPKPEPAWCSTPAPAATLDGAWERAVRWWTRAPQALMEPWAGACVNSLDAIRAFKREVPGLRLLVDTGHVADWGEDPVELLEFADHVQLRQGKPGHTQLHIDDASGVVDFMAVFQRLDQLDYQGKVSVEYFDLPEQSWSLEDPEQWALDLTAAVRH
ncbi:MAG TPA: TIM barrel protein [Acidimicrobiia bacterium]|jgi:sugar phosphate isomerase/epimerase|nr:TIM barrel protein [Acidimicrobiia bacterium]